MFLCVFAIFFFIIHTFYFKDECIVCRLDEKRSEGFVHKIKVI
jgi:hypothetical protein